MRKTDDTPVQIRVNDPNQPADDADAPYGQTPTIGMEDHDVTLSVGPSYESEREAANELTASMVQNIQQIAQVAGPKAAAKVFALAVKSQNIGAMGDEIADTISPPDTGQPDPQQLAQQLQQLQAQNQELKQLADDNQAKVTIAAHKSETDKQIAAAKAETDLIKNRADNETKLAVAELGAKVDRLTLFLEERGRLGVQAHEVGQAAMQHEHDIALADQAHQQTLQQAQQAGQQQQDLSAQGHQQALEQGAQQPPIDPNQQIAAEQQGGE